MRPPVKRPTAEVYVRGTPLQRGKRHNRLKPVTTNRVPCISSADGYRDSDPSTGGIIMDRREFFASCAAGATLPMVVKESWAKTHDEPRTFATPAEAMMSPPEKLA